MLDGPRRVGVHVDLNPLFSGPLADLGDDDARVLTQVTADAAVEDHPGRVDAHPSRIVTRSTPRGDCATRVVTMSTVGPQEPATSDTTPTADAAVPPGSSGGVVAAFFDIDNTIIRGASAAHLAHALYRREFFGIRDLVRLVVHNARYLTFGENKKQIDTVRSHALGIVKGHTVAEIVAVGEEVYDQVLELRIYPGTQRLLDEHRAAGHEVWLVSATPVEIGSLIARRLGGTGALGSVAETVDGVYTGRLVGDMMHGKAKAAGVKALAEERGIDLEASSAYGDSLNDVSMMQTVGNPCAINPDSRLRRHAARVGWPVREFRGRRNRAARRGAATLSWAGAAWATAMVVRSVKRAIQR